MSISPVFDYFKKSIIRPLSTGTSEACCSMKSLGKRTYQVGSAIFSGIGNWPFYGVASSFGDRFSPAFGGVLGASEVVSYFFFRIRNFEQLRQSFFTNDLDNEVSLSNDVNDNAIASDSLGVEPNRAFSISDSDEEQILPHTTLRLDNVPSKSFCRNFNLKSVAVKTTAAALGLVAQFPLMVLVYYGNEKNLIYPIICGACEGAFTILSLLMSFKSFKKPVSRETLDPELENKRRMLVEQLNRFLEELPSKYKDPDFFKKIDEIFSDYPTKTEDQRGKALLDLVLEAKGLPEIQRGSWDGVLSNVAKGLGVIVSAYVTAVNGAVSYKGVKAWRDDQEALAIIATVVISLANLKLLTKLCMDSAANYYEGVRDVISRQYRPPLAHAVAPIAWFVGRSISIPLSWLSFGTTAVSAGYIPGAGDVLVGPAPLSSALILTDNLNGVSDDLVLLAKSRSNLVVKQFDHLNRSLSLFKDKIQNSHPEPLKRFLSLLPNFIELQPRPRALNAHSPLIERKSRPRVSLNGSINQPQDA